MSARPVLIIAGGTGGHVFPALAVAQVLTGRSVPVVWLGTPNGLEARVVPAAGLPLETVSVRGLRGNGLIGWLKAPWMVGRAIVQALGVIRRHQPRVVLGMGGYVAGPGGVAARLRRLPLVIHEQNAIAGLTNRLLSRLATRVLTGLDAAFAQGVDAEFTGNPVRTEIADRSAIDSADHGGALRLLVIGGSLGALSLNRAVPQAIAALPEAERPDIRHQAGQSTLDIARGAYADAGVEARIDPFIDDMAEAYRWCDLVVCRAGALTVSELAAAGVPAILVPFPHAVDDHQTANARFLVNAGAARMIADRDLTPDSLAALLSELLGDRDRLRTMSAAAHQVGRPAAAERVADICMEVAA
ncbi:undecaprenyldiphospho-muramoylpentapeptide beta-N-acetylglucosaminyltransferase [Spiribacter insolitus]|uniref:UDP-N-acetylglucosamine--N-acetylmuramyl-(pentapeptide) pyrophosphoryl-undecaprenol N-acetylglucosamine transferase n=1 Tax=Spiribacter insolitus TaxID=3122417 RepID=A0ABV3T6Y0_9GAMM